MTNSQRLATVRAHLQQWLAANVMPRPCLAVTDVNESAGEIQEQTPQDSQSQADQEGEDEAKIVSESILIRDGFYAGRTFHATAQGDTFRATWFMEPDELKIHAAGGMLVASFQGEQIVAEAPALEEPALEEPVLEEPALEEPVLEEQDESSASDAGPISLPMPAAEDDSSDQDSDQQGQISKAA
ncbi:hypothetical protein Enr13x_36120 [Stieleria neptunia]|uniref:Uncharacterized protein n=1 Tax=Stieleria neptunia TaxID=2527979 RepID=A0A518HSH0_9BACT|nr:hypothetical protein [Stieleria neptunia]QDV43754.1 hypothetical protein Enr13x_36120 [Stieleria neptunia]